MDTYGRHLLVEYHGCNCGRLDDEERIRATMTRAAREAGATVVGQIFHRFRPHGVTGVVVVEESHLSIHTWPEHGYAAVDFYTCGAVDPTVAVALLGRELEAERTDVLVVERGQHNEPSLRVERPARPASAIGRHVDGPSA